MRMELKSMVGLEGHRANELRNDQRGGVQQGAYGSSMGVRTLRAREVVRRHAGSARNKVRWELLAVVDVLRLDEKHCDSPLLLQNQR